MLAQVSSRSNTVRSVVLSPSCIWRSPSLSPSRNFLHYYYHFLTHLVIFLCTPLVVHFYCFPPKLNYWPQFSAFAMNSASPHNRSEAFFPTSRAWAQPWDLLWLMKYTQMWLKKGLEICLHSWTRPLLWFYHWQEMSQERHKCQLVQWSEEKCMRQNHTSLLTILKQLK